MYNTYSNTMIAGTIAELLGAPSPEKADAARLEPLLELCAGGVDRVLLYNPDAVAMWLYQKYPDKFLPVLRHARLMLPMRTVMPSVTPVCFGTIYTGALPEVHGITKYEKPVIRIDSLFDALLRAGKKPIILATEGCSMSKIFNERQMDYIFVGSDGSPDGMYCVDEAMKVLSDDKYDAVIVYEGNYDTVMHRCGVNSPEALHELEVNAAHFDRIVRQAKRLWSGKRALYGWVTDHGCHDTEIGRGSHGSDLEDDLNVAHFWGVSGIED